MIRDIVEKSRSYRRFYQEKRLSDKQLTGLVDIARLTPSAANRQPFKYRIVCDEKNNEIVFENLGFAAYLKDWAGPDEGEKPTGYIIILCPEQVKAETDAGIVGQTMLLAAVEQGLGGCFFGNVNRDVLMEKLALPEGYRIEYVIAFGYPKEEVVIEEIPGDGDIKYYRDEQMVHHVPKKRLEDIIV